MNLTTLSTFTESQEYQNQMEFKKFEKYSIKKLDFCTVNCSQKYNNLKIYTLVAVLKRPFTKH